MHMTDEQGHILSHNQTLSLSIVDGIHERNSMVINHEHFAI